MSGKTRTAASASVHRYLHRMADYLLWCPTSTGPDGPGGLAPPAEQDRSAAPRSTRCRLAATWTRRSRVHRVEREVGELELSWSPPDAGGPFPRPSSPWQAASPHQVVASPCGTGRWQIHGLLRLGTDDRVWLEGVGADLEDVACRGFAAVLDLKAGTGQFAGRSGLMVLNGTGRGPTMMILRLEKGPRHLSRGRKLAGQPGDGQAFALRGRLDPGHPATVELGADGQMRGARVREMLFQADQPHGAGQGSSWRPSGELHRTSPRGQIDFRVRFAPLPGAQVTSFTTQDGLFRFRDEAGAEVGTLRADMQLGRAFSTSIPGVPTPVFRMGGAAPAHSGSGLFQNVRGLVTVNSVLGLEPQFISSVFLLRLDDGGERPSNSREVFRSPPSRSRA